MKSDAHIVPPGFQSQGVYEQELDRRLDKLLAQHAGELAKLGWFARRRRERELQRWIESELSCLVRAGKLPPKRDWLARELLDAKPPVIH